MEIAIQKAQYTDLPEILALQKECYLQEAAIYKDYQIPPLVQTVASMEADFEQQIFLKLTEGKQIIGSVRAYAENTICKIGRLIVHRDFQNRGLGRRLMKAIEKEFFELNTLELFTGHLSVKNLAFYKKLGYTEFQRKQIHNGLTLVFLQKKRT